MIETKRSCGYFRRKADGVIWAILLIDDRPWRAVQMIDTPDVTEHPAKYNLRTGVKAKSWTLDDFEQLGESFTGVGHRGGAIPFSESII